MERLGLGRRTAGLALFNRRQQGLAAEIGGEIESALAVFRLECVEPHNRGNAIEHLLDGARAGPTAIGMDDQTNVVEVFPFDHVDDVGDVSDEDDILAHEVRALADAGESWREHLVAALLRKIGHAPPAPAAVPGAVHEHEVLRRTGLRRCWRAAQSCCARAGPCACQDAAAGHRSVVGRSHRVLPTCCLLAQSYLGRVRSSRTAQTENAWACIACPPYPATRPPCG